jgi:nucleoside-diphosphate-sugar epimerase
LIGRATARRLLARGWRVDVVGRDRSHLPTDIAECGGRFVEAARDDQGQLLPTRFEAVICMDMPSQTWPAWSLR